MSYLIDTNVISELIKPTPDQTVIQWFLKQDEFALHLSVVTVGEIVKGIEKLNDPAKKKKLEQWLQEDLMVRFGNRIIGIGIEEIGAWGKILADGEKSGYKYAAVDALCIATAFTHELKLVTRNVSDMHYPGVTIINPFEPAF